MSNKSIVIWCFIGLINFFVWICIAKFYYESNVESEQEVVVVEESEEYLLDMVSTGQMHEHVAHLDLDTLLDKEID